MSDTNISKIWGNIQPFFYGGTAGMFATICIQPIDMLKVQIQLSGEKGSSIKGSNPLLIAKSLIKRDGFFSLYNGLTAGLLRQATYTTARMGIFRTVSNKLKDENGKLEFSQRVIAGLTAGGIGSVFGNPCDLALVRMQADTNLPIAQRRNYKNVGNALSRIVKEEGIWTLWKGCLPTVLRAMALNVGMLATYDQAMDVFSDKLGSRKATIFVSSTVAGFFASAASLPFDFIKTRIQKQKKNSNGTFPYKGMIDCAVQATKNEGLFVFYKGFTTYYIRIAPHAMITLLAAEVLRSVFGDVNQE